MSRFESSCPGKAILDKIRQYKENNDEVVYLDTHYDNYLETQEGKPACPSLPERFPGWKLYGKVAELCEENDKCFKETFGSIELVSYLSENKYDSVELIGWCLISVF